MLAECDTSPQSSPMASRVCPNCQGLNGTGEVRCYRCGRRLPGPLRAFLSPLLEQRYLVSRGLSLACLAVFALAVLVDRRLPLLPELGLGEPFRRSTLLRFGALPSSLIEPWRLLSAVFVHFSVLHVGLNLWALLGLGAPLEDRFGKARTFLIFVLTGVGGFVTSSFWYAHGITAGASGGIFGFLGTQVGILITRRAPGWKDALIQQLAYAAILGLLMRVNTAAHLGGLAIGVGLGTLFERERVRPVSSLFLSGFALLALFAGVASIVLSASSPLWQIVRDYSLEE